MTEPAISIDTMPEGVVVRLAGSFVVSALGVVERAFSTVPVDRGVVVDLSDVDVLDTGGAWLLATLMARLKDEGVPVSLQGATAAQQALIDTVAKNLPRPDGMAEPEHGLRAWLEHLGRTTMESLRGVAELLGFLGLVIDDGLSAPIHRPWFRCCAQLIGGCRGNSIQNGAGDGLGACHTIRCASLLIQVLERSDNAR
jgi:phospholipid/cholesterol/gamma-HCH transport system permease protein